MPVFLAGFMLTSYSPYAQLLVERYSPQSNLLYAAREKMKFNGKPVPVCHSAWFCSLFLSQPSCLLPRSSGEIRITAPAISAGTVVLFCSL